MRISLFFAAPLAVVIAVPALADKPEAAAKPVVAAKAETTEKAEDEKEPKADKRICRHIRADASSRRKTKVCMTSEEWREANRGQ